MPTGMEVTNRKLVKGGRKLKEAKHCTISKSLNKYEKKKKKKRASGAELKIVVEKEKSTKEKMQKNAPNQVRECF